MRPRIPWRTGARALATLVALVCWPAVVSRAQTVPGWGRFSLFLSDSSSRADGGFTATDREVITSLTLRAPVSDADGLDYGLDVRQTSYAASELPASTSIYDAYLGVRTGGGRFTLRMGQMWLNDLGALGSVGGFLVEFRQPPTEGGGHLRFGLFGGLEPNVFTAGYVAGVRKGGAYVAWDGSSARRHVLGYVTIRQHGLVERSVLTTYNFIPAGRTFFLYQVAEYDLKGPAGIGKGGLNYFFATARLAPVEAFEVQATYHRGRSIDTRTITTDVLNGRPVDPRALEGLLFESAGGRITVQVVRGLRLWAGYARDRNNQEDKATARTTAGLSAINILGSGFDFTASDSRMHRPTGSYDSLYVSLGKTLGSRVYLSADYTTSLSVFRIVGSDGVVVENRPQSRRTSLTSNINLSRVFSLFFTAEHLTETGSRENRVLTGLTVRF